MDNNYTTKKNKKNNGYCGDEWYIYQIDEIDWKKKSSC